jgi:hypothetical protein
MSDIMEVDFMNFRVYAHPRVLVEEKKRWQ